MRGPVAGGAQQGAGHGRGHERLSRPPSRPPRSFLTGARPPRARAGFTLTEVLVAVAVAAVIMTISVAALSRLSGRDRLTATQQAVRALLRRARNAAREERYPAQVELDPARSQVRAQQRTAITQLRFEGLAGAGALDDAAAPPPLFEVAGARGYTLSAEGAEPVAGRYGGGLLFERESRAYGAAWAWIPDRPALTPLEGVHLACWLYLGPLEERLHERPPERPSAAQAELWGRAGEPPRAPALRVLGFDPLDPPIFWAVRKGRAYALGVTAAYEVELALTGPDADGDEVTFITRTRPGTLRPERWYRVEAAFDGREARVIVDGIGREHLPLPGHDRLPVRLVREPALPVAISDPDPRQAFYGVIDELELAGILRAQALEVPPDVVLAAPGPRVVFDPLGQLDPARHPEPIVLYLTDDDRLWAVAEGEAGATRTHDEQARAEAARGAPRFVGEEEFRRFVEEVLPTLDPGRVRRLVVERSGLVTE